ncbi:sensor histidine kinase [Micromonospora sp. WMMD708]|uniref:sensor histidine kinase n=1 Tax=Micromonospora sp. WMMD708 TaxID=3403464 RepID=UPI003BF54A03
MARAPGLSVRLKLTVSYAGFVMLAGALLLGTVWVFLLRYVPEVIDTPRPPAPAPDSSPPPTPVMFVPDRFDLLRAFAPRAVQVLAILLVFGLLGGWLLAGRMLAPLTRVTHATRMAAAGSLSHRVRLEGRQDEFRELADAFDSMLERLESHVAEQQRFAANASHELRTPLAISRTLLDVARRDPDAGPAELLDRLHAVNQRAIDLTEALLLLGHGDRGTFTRTDVDLSLLAEEAAETLLHLAERRRTTLEVTGGAARTSGSAELLLRMVTNLVQNAVVHNLPTGGAVTVHTGTSGDTILLRIENTGRRLPPELVPTFTEPFQRGTERVRTDEHAGFGLGLAIVHSIVRAHAGTLDLVARPDGGLTVTVRLPGTGHPRRTG